MLDNAPVHIHQVQRTVRAIISTNRTEAFIGAGQKFFVFVGELARNMVHLVINNVPLSQVCCRLGHKGVFLVVMAKQVATVKDRSAGGSKVSQTEAISSNGISVTRVDKRIATDGE